MSEDLVVQLLAIFILVLSGILISVFNRRRTSTPLQESTPRATKERERVSAIMAYVGGYGLLTIFGGGAFGSEWLGNSPMSAIIGVAGGTSVFLLTIEWIAWIGRDADAPLLFTPIANHQWGIRLFALLCAVVAIAFAAAGAFSRN